MNRKWALTCLTLSLSLSGAGRTAAAQVPAEKFDMRDLGVPFMNAIPTDENAITSLIAGPDGEVFGGTTGTVCHLFSFSPSSNKVTPLGQIPGQESIHHGLALGPDGMIYIGTGRNEEKQHPLSDPPPGHGGILISLWSDIQKRYEQYPGGHVYRYDPRKREAKQPGEPLNVEDLGAPVANNGIYTLVASPKRSEIYGLTYPDGHFFVYDMTAGKHLDKGEVYKNKVYAGPNRSLRSISGALVCDAEGNVYGSGDDHFLFKYDPDSGKILRLRAQIPRLYIGVVEAFAQGADSWIYGGTNEGFVFKFDPETEAVVNLGKPIDQMRIRGLTVGQDRRVYGVAGEQTGACHFFFYDPQTGGYTDYGPVTVDRPPYYDWLGKQFDAVAAGSDGTIYIGEAERKSHLFLFFPGP